MEKVTTAKLQTSKSKLQKISMLTAYDYSFAKVLDDSGVDIILVGDSLGNVILGHKNTLPVTMEDMIHHTKAVAKGVERALHLADIPYKACSLENARRLVEAGAEGVKVEGMADIEGVREIIKAGIPVMGHLGCLPQTAKEYKVQRSSGIIEEAKILEQVGVFSLVLELVAPEIAKKATEALRIPTIGIGSGPHCDGQVLVTHDMLGLYPNAPRHAKKYVDLSSEIKKAVRNFISDII